MGRTRLIIAAVLVAAGLVWIGQGFGLLRGGSFMVDDQRWAWIGVRRRPVEAERAARAGQLRGQAWR